jgi:diguanylate cyclase (GGDEF)-like protein/PAS domain S-box-containing protein
VSTERLPAAFEGLSVGMILKDAAGGTLESNPALRRMLGYSEEELRGMVRSDFTHPEDVEKDADLYRQLLAGQRDSYRIEKRYVRKDGDVMWGCLSVSRIEGAEGEPAFTVGVVEDITERKEAEQALKESEERYRAVMEHSVEAIYLYDPDSKRILESNEAFQKLIGYTAEELLQMTIYDFNAHHKDNVDANVRRSLRERGRFVGERNYHRKDGSRITVEISTSVIPYDGKPALCTVSRDITERKRFEEALRESEGRFRQLFEHSTDALLVHDEHGRMVDCNAEACRSLGYTREELLELSVKDFATDVLSEEEKRARKGDTPWKRAMTAEPGTVVGFHENEHRRKDGTTFPVEVGIGAIDYEGRRLIFASARDITERKHAEERLRQSEERYRAVIEQTVEGIYLGAADTKRVLESNAAFQEMLGYTAEELCGMHIYEFVAHDRENIDSVFQSVLDKGHCFIGERRYRRKDGSMVDVETSATVISYGNREVLCTVVRDVTERKATEEALKESEERYRTVVEQSAESIWLFDPDTKQVLESNTAFQEMLGYTAEELRRMTNYDFVAHSRDDIDSAVQRVVQERRGFFGERKYRRKDGTVLDVEVSGTVIPYRGREVVCGVARDLTERKRAEEALKESEERFRGAFNDAPIGVALVGLDGRYLRVNRALCEMLGYSEEELLEKTTTEVTHPDDCEAGRERTSRVLEEGVGGNYHLEKRYVHAEGRTVWVLSSVSLVRDPQGNPSHFVSLYQDITERKALEERLEYQAFHDSLTDLPNRTLFLDRLEHALARASREGGSVAVLLVDLDDFKAINDSLGHDAGNAVLVEVAERLRAGVRPGDTVGRIFGDEFAVLLEAPVGMEEARQIAERIQEGLQAPFGIDGQQEAFVRGSIGIALGKADKDEPEEVLKHADLAMYEAKHHGKAYCEVYNPSMNYRIVERLDLEKDLRRAIEREEFEVHYQPKVLLETGAIVGVEALVRWEHPDKGLLPATEFIQLAEETGLIDRIGLWVLKRSCRQLKEWHERYPTKFDPPFFGLCVNLSAREIKQPDLSEKVAKVLRETGLDPRCLMLEISERTAMKDAESTIGKLRELKDLGGVKLALDDFGTGYCSLVYLEHSLLDILKIDRLLIHRDREDPEESATIISAMTSMAHSLGLEVIVEGVETEEQLTKLKEIGCEMAQGYYFAKPLPAEGLERLLQESASR